MYDQVVQISAEPPDAVEFAAGGEETAQMDTTEPVMEAADPKASGEVAMEIADVADAPPGLDADDENGSQWSADEDPPAYHDIEFVFVVEPDVLDDNGDVYCHEAYGGPEYWEAAPAMEGVAVIRDSKHDEDGTDTVPEQCGECSNAREIIGTLRASDGGDAHGDVSFDQRRQELMATMTSASGERPRTFSLRPPGIKLGGVEGRPDLAGMITFLPGQNLECAVMIGGQEFMLTVDTGAARSLLKGSLLEQLRANSDTALHCFERLGATNPKKCSVAAGEAQLQVPEAQLLALKLAGYKVEYRRGEPVITKNWTDDLLMDIPFGVTEGLAEDFIMGFPECLGVGAQCYYQVVDGVREVYVIFNQIGLAIPARVVDKFKAGLPVPEPIRRIKEYTVDGWSTTTLPVKVSAKDLEQGKWVTGCDLDGVEVVRQPLRDIVSDKLPDPEGSVEAHVTVMVVQDEDVDFPLGGTAWECDLPDEMDLKAYRESAKRCCTQAHETQKQSEEKVGWSRDGRGEVVLAVKSSVKCRREHERSWTKTSCGHVYCTVCSGYVEPTSMVTFCKPKPTVWCNRKPNPKASYEYLFAEVGCDRPRLTEAVQRVLRGTKVAKFADMKSGAKWFADMRTKLGWDRVKVAAKARTVLFTHFSPPWQATRQLRIAEAQRGAEHKWTKSLAKTEEFGRK